MNPNIINLLITLLVLWMLFGLFNSILAFALSKHGIGVFLLIFVMYQLYKRSKSVGRQGGTYYDHINTYSNTGPGGFEYSSGRPQPGRGFLASIRAWFDEKYRSYYYWRFKKTWEKIREKYRDDMRCPACGSELTVFNISADARCNFCKNKLL